MEAQKYPGREKEFIEMYRNNPEAMATMRAPIFEEKVVDFILELANVTDREVSIEELMQLPDAEGGAAEDEKKETKKAATKPKRKKTAAKKDESAEDDG